MNHNRTAYVTFEIRACCCLLAVVITGVASLPLRAQTVLEEIIVTAQKREQSLQDVSISVTALSGEMIETLGFQTAVAVAAQAPNVLFRTTGPLPTFTIRGVTLIDVGDGNEPPVGFYVDEVYRGVPAGQANQLYDLERVEILRGPQGTLFGRNTTGGLVHYITRKPTDELTARASFQYGSFDQKIVEGAISGPFSETVRGRVAFKYNKDDGWQDNETLGTDFAATDTLSGRAHLEVDIGQNANALLSVSASDQDNEHNGYGFAGTFDPATMETCSTSAVNSGQCINAFGFNVLDPDPEEVFSEESSLPDEVDLFSTTLRLEWQVAGLSIISLSAYETVDKKLNEDADASPTAPVSFNYRVDTEQFSQEFRVAAEYERSRWQAGAFYYNDERDDMFNSVPFFVMIMGTLGNQTEAELETDSWALFAQGDYEITDTLTLTGGLRFTSEEKDLFITDSRAAPSFADSENADTDKVTGTIGLEWRPNGDVMTYLKASTGFKSPAFNTTQVLPGEAAPVGEEEILAIEAGLRSVFWDERMKFNVSAFYYDYEDLQSVAVVSTGGPVPRALFINAGDADVYGLEAELVTAPVENLEIMLGLGLMDTEISADSDLTVDGFPLDGNELTHSPSVNFNGIVRYHIPTNIGRFTLQTDFRWQDDILLSIDNDPFDAQDSYGVVNLRALWTSASERYFGEVFVDNVLDEDYFEGAFTVRDFGFRAAIWGKPRWAGIRVGVQY